MRTPPIIVSVGTTLAKPLVTDIGGRRAVRNAIADRRIGDAEMEMISVKETDR